MLGEFDEVLFDDRAGAMRTQGSENDRASLCLTSFVAYPALTVYMSSIMQDHFSNSLSLGTTLTLLPSLSVLLTAL